jgi:hypothetical protein
VLDAEFLDKTRRENTRGKSSAKNFVEFGVKASNSHVLEFEVRCQDGIRCCPDGGADEFSGPQGISAILAF